MTKIQTWTCQRCGKACERQVVRGRPPKFCGVRCQKRSQAKRHEIVCVVCHSTATTYAPDVKTCSRSCRGYLQRGVTFSRSTEMVVWQQATRECDQCGERFAARRSTQRFCSSRCGMRSAWARRHRRRGEFSVSAKRRRRLYERDGWTCGICDTATSRTYDPHDPLSPTLDHVEPQSFALIPDHSDQNLRTAHAICNALRADGLRSDGEVREMVEGRKIPPTR